MDRRYLDDVKMTDEENLVDEVMNGTNEDSKQFAMRHVLPLLKR